MHIILRLLYILLVVSLVLMLQACAPVTTKKEQPITDTFQQQINILVQAGDFVTAAEILENMALTGDPGQRDAYLLQAAELRSMADDWSKTEALLDSISAPFSDDELAMRQRMLQAELALSQGDLDLSLKLLQPPPGPDSPLQIRQRYHKNKAEIFRMNGNLLESARELVHLDNLLSGSDDQLANQEQLVQTLSIMTETALGLLQPEPPGILGGWMELVRIFKQQSEDPKSAEPYFQTWREAFPDHPAMPELLTNYLTQQVIDQSSHIAVLLPRTGPFSKVAVAVSDGFMAAWYQRPVANRPALRFYDSSSPEQILQLYEKALQHGATMMVGPLNKQAVSYLLEADLTGIPVLTLNQVEQDNFNNPNLFQFGLAPEDEAEQVAERAWLDGHTKALVLTPTGDWGQRIYLSFRDRWHDLGGRVIEHQTYEAKANDFSQPIRRLLNVDESKTRKQELQRILGVPIESEPHRRQDAQFIFLAARPQKGRQLGPQLKFHHAGDLPIYATSHIYNSAADIEKDKDLGKIKFVDTPWLLEESSEGKLSRKQLEKTIPGVKSKYARLYAMGIDAFNLLSYITKMQHQPGLMLNGKSGNLYLDTNNHLHRQLAWADINDGRAKITGYAPRLQKSQTGTPLAPISQPISQGHSFPAAVTTPAFGSSENPEPKAN